MAILMRRGTYSDLDTSKLLPGEWAISTDGTILICYAAGYTKQLMSMEDLENIGDYLDLSEVVDEKLQELIEDGTLSAMTVEDGTITLNKLSTDLKAYLANILTSAKEYSDEQNHWAYEVVDTLPEEGEKMTFYFLKINTGIYRTYIYYNSTFVNTSGDDLSDYYTKDEVDEIEAALKKAIAAIDTSDVNQLSIAIIDSYLYLTNNGIVIGDGIALTDFDAVSEDTLAEYLADYAKTSEVQDLIAAEIHFKKSVVDELPETGEDNVFYLIWDADNECYNEYWYIGGTWDQIGSTKVDLDGYYTKTEVDALVTTLSDKIDASANSDDLDALKERVTDVESQTTSLAAEVETLSTLIDDVTLNDDGTGIIVYFHDGTSKELELTDGEITVSDVNASDTGITIEYTDGSSKDIEISGGSGGTSTSGSATIKWVNGSSIDCVYGDECNMVYTFTAVDSAGDTVGNGTATWYVGGIQKATSTALQGENTFDIGPYLSAGSNTIRLSISVDTGGESNTVTTKSATVNAVNMYVEWDYDDATINTSDLILRWTPYGSLSKTTHILIDDEEAVSSTTTRSGTQQTATISKLSHGSHMAELYVTATVNNTEISTESIYHDLIFVDTDDTTPIIACSYPGGTMTQYNTESIPIMIYDPSSLTATATLLEDGTTVAEWTDIDRTVHYWNYTPSTSGDKTLQIVCGSTVKTISITVTALDIDNEEVSGYAFRMKASDFAGNEALKAWESEGASASFSDNFDWDNGGIQTETDDDGNIRQFICVKAGTTMTIDYTLFSDDAKKAGKNFKVIFKATNCRSYDAEFLSCLNSGIGITMYANSASVTSEQTTTSTSYIEDEYTEFEFDIYPDSSYRYLQTWIDGINTGCVVYADNDNFTQSTAQQIVIGSEDCDVYIYMIKAYANYITRDNHVENFIADAPNATEMVDRYNRNNILDDSGEISYEKLSDENQDLRVHLWDIPRMTEGKKDYVDGCEYQQIYGAGGAEHQITASGVRISIQGTSSVDYKDWFGCQKPNLKKRLANCTKKFIPEITKISLKRKIMPVLHD